MRQRIYMIPNRYGAVAGILFLVFALVAATYSNNLLFLFSFLHISFLLVSILQTAKNLRSIEVSILQIPSGFPNENVGVKIQITNKSKNIKTGLHFKVDKCPHEKWLQILEAKDQLIVSVPLILASKRGRHNLSRIRVSTESPYGLFWGWYYVKTPTDYFVYPKPEGTLTLPLSSEVSTQEFSGLKDYQAGDSLQRVSWKHLARTDHLIVKEFKDNEQQTLDLNIKDCIQQDKEAKLSQLCLWIQRCDALKLKYRLVLNEDTAPLGSGLAHYHNSLLKLAKETAP